MNSPKFWYFGKDKEVATKNDGVKTINASMTFGVKVSSGTSADDISLLLSKFGSVIVTKFTSEFFYAEFETLETDSIDEAISKINTDAEFSKIEAISADEIPQMEFK